MQNFFQKSFFLLALLAAPLAFAAGKAEHVVVVVWDGMRPDFISKEHTPTLWQLAHDGVMFENHHPVYCSSTEVNGTAIATGCYPEHSGIIGNRDYFPQVASNVVDVQSFKIVRKGDEVWNGNYLMRPTLAEILRGAGKSTVIAGTKEIALLHDRKERAENSAVDLFMGKTVPPGAIEKIKKSIGENPKYANAKSALPNAPCDDWTTRALIGPLWSNGVPDFSLLWLSEPDFSQHAAGPGSPKALAALESSDRCLAKVLADLERRGLRDKTDIFVVSDHGFSTSERPVDVCKVLRDAGFSIFREFIAKPKRGDILTINEGGSQLFYVTDHDAETIRKLAEFLQQQDFSGVVFSREKIRGTFSFEDAKINSPRAPDVLLAMRWSAGKSANGTPGLLVDGGRPRGQGSHASLSHFDMHNTLVGAGPDLKTNFSDTLPTGNVDVAPTILWLLGAKSKSPMDGRVLSEALSIPSPKVSEPATKKIEAERAVENSVWHQYLQISRVNDTIYLDEGNGWIEKK
jgi:arylsulfatase A-like enzyme